jgi:1,4-dihydroxy-2-naphthoate octaprenyltransferase
MVNLRMWGRALYTIQRVDRAGWDKLDIVSRFLVASRASVLVITFISVAIAGLLAIRFGRFDPVLWGLAALALLLAHATNNLLNDLTDHVKGVDTNNYFRAIYGPHALEHKLLSVRGLLAYAAFSGLIAIAIGAYLVSVRGPVALWLMVAGAVFVLFYTYPLKYIGLGEVAVILVWGPLMIGGTYFVTTGLWNWDVVLVGVPYALGATTVIFGKHIDKLSDDKTRGIHTLPVLVGERTARWILGTMIVLMYGIVVYLVAIQFLTPIVLVVFLAIPQARTALALFAKPRPTERPDSWPKLAWPLYFVRVAFVHNRRFGLLFLIGLGLDVALRFVLPT